ncbi:type 4a pilus biogenesis protein PilO [Iodobacter fluviatilis]|uniref:Pilus assembly protein, PilO n=1 Tax=Iodobacter fluviatilis TaxID=537 RepID=A0A377SSU6_9NEIS|nr:type 4a pilus biogenesis protein PilO [Iodobacter fluviatilis]TCU82207.1 type IV pilus assembly protein PilO [Iodobacter fluviatilis]STR45102.1 Pilus assembly protein, PilO [Iodobacter fluviatilis]
MTLDELRNLDPKDVGNWPMAAQIGLIILVFVVLISGGYFYVWGSQMEELETGRAKEEQLKKDFIDKKSKAINLDAYRQQLQEIQQSFGALLRQLPNKSEMESLLTEINQAGVGRGLFFELFKPGSEVKTSEFAELPIDIRISGNYHDLAAFVSDVAQLSRIVTLSNLQLVSTKDPEVISMQAIAKTYRSLDEAELQAMHQAALDAKKKQK